MKQGYLKYSDERNRRFSIKTAIRNRDGKKTVSKQAVFEEGQEHLEHMFESQKKLKTYYSEAEICQAEKQGYELVFEYVEGELLLDWYVRIAAANDMEKYEQLLQYHKQLICGNEENQCTFEKNDEFEEWFGEAAPYEGTRGLVYSNFDAIAGNIIMKEDKPVFIDYEWTMDFVMPEDLVVYHCIYDGYLHHSELEAFYPFEKVLAFLGIAVDIQVLEKSYHHFFDYVVSEQDGSSYGKDKFGCLKPMMNTVEMHKEWQYCAQEWQKCADEWKKAVEANSQAQEEIAYIRGEWQKCADEWKKTVEILDESNQEKADLQNRYDQIVNSRWWRIRMKIRRIWK